jgi:ankyrin repeat protein
MSDLSSSFSSVLDSNSDSDDSDELFLSCSSDNDSDDGAIGGALVIAAIHSKLPCEYVERLLRSGADVNFVDELGRTPLRSAVFHLRAVERWLMVELLLKVPGVDVDQRSLRGRTALIEAVLFRDVRLTSMLLEANADPNVGDDEGARPLTFALSGRACSIAIVKLLISRGADVNHGRQVFVRIGVGHKVETPCALAAELSDAQFVEAILAAGAEPDDYAFEVAAQNFNGDVMSALLANNSRWPLDARVLEAAAAHVSAKLFEDAVDRQQSPLWPKLCHAAARTRDPLVLKFLISRGMPVDEETIDTAAGNAHADVMIAALASAGRSVRLSAQALEAAVTNKNPAVLALLINAGIDLRMPNSAGQCVLDLAVNASNITTLALCLTANVDLPPTSTHLRCVTTRFEAVLREMGYNPIGSGYDEPNVRAEHPRALLHRVGLPLWRNRALEICMAMFELELDALRMHMIVTMACNPLVAEWPFHRLWNIVVLVKHWKDRHRR